MMASPEKTSGTEQPVGEHLSVADGVGTEVSGPTEPATKMDNDKVDRFIYDVAPRVRSTITASTTLLFSAIAVKRTGID